MLNVDNDSLHDAEVQENNFLFLFLHFAVFNLTYFCKVLTFFLCTQSTQELPCNGVKLKEEVTAERGVSLISVVQLIFEDVEATGEVKGVVNARGGAAVETLDAVALFPTDSAL